MLYINIDISTCQSESTHESLRDSKTPRRWKKEWGHPCYAQLAEREDVAQMRAANQKVGRFYFTDNKKTTK